MAGIIVTGHGGLADGIMVSLKMIAGEQKDIVAVGFADGEGTEDLKVRLNAALDAQAQEEIVVMADLAGGTPYNVAAMLAMERGDKRIRVISGLNLPMLVESAMSRDFLDLDALVATALRAGKEGIRLFEETPACRQEADGEGI